MKCKEKQTMFARSFHSTLVLCLATALTSLPVSAHASYPPGPAAAPQPPVASPDFLIRKPDLVITKVQRHVDGNGQEQAYVLLQNLGTAPAKPSSIMMQDYQGQWVAQNFFNTTVTIPAGGQSWCVMNVAIPVNAPGHIMRYTVDFNNVVAEINENNNSYTVDNVPK